MPSADLFPAFRFGRPQPTDTGSKAPAVGRRIALVGTFSPRKCGIATFTTDVSEQLGRFHPEIAIDVYALDNPARPLAYPQGVETIDANDPEAFRRAADAINASGVAAVWLQHEYGIFGGESGAMVSDFVDRLAPPLILTCHTVLAQPDRAQHDILAHLLTRASQIMVMSPHSRNLLASRYGAAHERIAVIEHGAPDRPFGRTAEFKALLGLADRPVMMTFGLLGPGKGLEQVIGALPVILTRHPRACYRIVGATHPNLVAAEGEAYRDRLVSLAQDLGVAHAVEWDNRFLDTDELLDQLEACDIYLTPYLDLGQSTSGTLSYAVALGKAVISTPYVHACELLDDGVGRLIEPDTTASIAEAVNDLLVDPEQLLALQRRAYQRGRQTIWPCFAAASERLIKAAVAPQPARVDLGLPPSLEAVLEMSDGTGMLQHAIGIVPDRRHGYCLDDNARTLMLLNVASAGRRSQRRRLAVTCASFVQFAWNADAGVFRNFMGFDRRWCEERGSEDSNGRAIWALGQTAEMTDDPALSRWACAIYDQAMAATDALPSPRARCFAALGAAAMTRVLPGHSPSLEWLDRTGEFLMQRLAHARREGWTWFEDGLAYDNARMPQALLEAGDALGRQDWCDAGLETLAWLAQRETVAEGHYRPVGSESFGRPRAALPFDQQPLEALAAIDASRAAYRISGDPHWIDHAEKAWAWFFGANDRGVVLANRDTGACHDGINPLGVNLNCGAESILAFQLAYYSMTALYMARESPMEDATFEPARPRAANAVTHL